MWRHLLKPSGKKPTVALIKPFTGKILFNAFNRYLRTSGTNA